MQVRAVPDISNSLKRLRGKELQKRLLNVTGLAYNDEEHKRGQIDLL